MPNVLQVYREKQANVYKRISAHTLPTKEVLQMQELNYRIFVIETFQAFCKSAPMGMDTKPGRRSGRPPGYRWKR